MNKQIKCADCKENKPLVVTDGEYGICMSCWIKREFPEMEDSEK